MDRRIARRTTIAAALIVAGTATGLAAGPAQAATSTTALVDGRVAITPIPIPSAYLPLPSFKFDGGGGIRPVYGS